MNRNDEIINEEEWSRNKIWRRMKLWAEGLILSKVTEEIPVYSEGLTFKCLSVSP